jgi:uncharacterized protein (UPF0276 family)
MTLSAITNNIELSGGSEAKVNLLEELIAIKKLKNLNFLVHSYFPPPKNHFVLNFADISNTTRNFIDESMRYIKALDIEYYSIHAGFKKDFDIKDEILDGGSTIFGIDNIYKNIEWYYKNYNQTIAIENLYPNNKNDTCFANHIDEIVEILEHDSRIYLLLDLGHLKVSSRLLGFNYLKAIETLFNKYASRILEIHLSENSAEYDEHLPIYSDSVQYFIIDKYKEIIKNNKINITLEIRDSSVEELKQNYELFNDLIGE